MHLIFLPSKVIYFSFKNNTNLSFSSINNGVNYFSFKQIMTRTIGECMCKKRIKSVQKEKIIHSTSGGYIENYWCKEY